MFQTLILLDVVCVNLTDLVEDNLDHHEANVRNTSCELAFLHHLSCSLRPVMLTAALKFSTLSALH